MIFQEEIPPGTKTVANATPFVLLFYDRCNSQIASCQSTDEIERNPGLTGIIHNYDYDIPGVQSFLQTPEGFPQIVRAIIGRNNQTNLKVACAFCMCCDNVIHKVNQPVGPGDIIADNVSLPNDVPDDWWEMDCKWKLREIPPKPF